MEGIVSSISDAVKAGLDKDCATMGTSIAEAVAKGVDFIAGFFG